MKNPWDDERVLKAWDAFIEVWYDVRTGPERNPAQPAPVERKERRPRRPSKRFHYRWNEPGVFNVWTSGRNGRDALIRIARLAFPDGVPEGIEAVRWSSTPPAFEQAKLWEPMGSVDEPWFLYANLSAAEIQELLRRIKSACSNRFRIEMRKGDEGEWEPL